MIVNPYHRPGTFRLLPAVLVVAVALTGCAKRAAAPVDRPAAPMGRPVETSTGPSCLPAEATQAIGQIKDVFDISPKQRFKWLDVVIARCGPWPGFVHKAVKVFRPFDPNVRSVTLSRTPLYKRKDYIQAMEKLCPGYQKTYDRQMALLRTPANRSGVYDRWYKLCRGKQRGVVTRQELGRGTTTSFIGMMLYEQLRKKGVTTALARIIGRLLLRGHPMMAQVWKNKLKLATSRSTTELAWVVNVAISQTEISCQDSPVVNIKNGRVAALAKRDGPQGFFIDPLFMKLKNERKKSHAAAKVGGRPFAGNLLLLLDVRTRYRLFAEVMYTAAQAGFSQFQLAVKHPKHQLRVVHLPPLLPTPQGRRRTPGIAAPLLTFPQLTQSPKAFVVQHGSPRVTKRFPYGPTTVHKALEQALSYLRKQKAAGTGSPQWGRIRVAMDPESKVGELIRNLDQLLQRTGPKAGAAATRGCFFTFDRRTATWTLPSAARALCWFPKPELALGSL